MPSVLEGGEAPGLRRGGGVARRRGLGHGAQGLDPRLARPRRLGAAGADDRRGDRADHAGRLQERRRPSATGSSSSAIITRDFATNEIVRAGAPDAPARGQRPRPGERRLQRASPSPATSSGRPSTSAAAPGQDATASAVISDIADAVALLLHGKGAHLHGRGRAAGRQGRPPGAAGADPRPLLRQADGGGPARRPRAGRDHHGPEPHEHRERDPGPLRAARAPPRSSSRPTRATSARCGAALRALGRLGSVREAPLLLRIGDFGD